MVKRLKYMTAHQQVLAHILHRWSFKFMHILHLQLGLNQDVSDLMSSGHWFYILGPNVFRLLASYVMVF